MSDAVYITIVICATLIALVVIGAIIGHLKNRQAAEKKPDVFNLTTDATRYYHNDKEITREEAEERARREGGSHHG